MPWSLKPPSALCYGLTNPPFPWKVSCHNLTNPPFPWNLLYAMVWQTPHLLGVTNPQFPWNMLHAMVWQTPICFMPWSDKPLYASCHGLTNPQFPWNLLHAMVWQTPICFMPWSDPPPPPFMLWSDKPPISLKLASCHDLTKRSCNLQLSIPLIKDNASCGAGFAGWLAEWSVLGLFNLVSYCFLLFHVCVFVLFFVFCTCGFVCLWVFLVCVFFCQWSGGGRRWEVGWQGKNYFWLKRNHCI